MLSDKIRWVGKFLFVIAAIFLTGSTDVDTNSAKKRYHIKEGSKLYLKGTSNVNAFTCDCEDQYTQQTLEIERSGGYARFRNVELLLKSKKL